MCPADRLVLRVGRARYYEDQAALVANGIALAFASPEKGAGDGEK